MRLRRNDMNKIQPVERLVKIRARLRRQRRTVVFTNGCFDLIHGGHIHLFREAKAQGDVLIVAANSDASIRRLKGPSRPVFPLAERMEVLAAFADIDYVTWFGQDTPQKIIAALLPDVLVKGGDWARAKSSGRRKSKEPGAAFSGCRTAAGIPARTSSKKSGRIFPVEFSGRPAFQSFFQPFERFLGFLLFRIKLEALPVAGNGLIVAV